MRSKIFGIAIALLAIALFIGSARVATAVDDWETALPADAGMDATKLGTAMKFASERDSYGAVIVHGGKIVAEQYWNDWDMNSTGDMCSAQKSISSALIGFAIEAGFIKGLDQSASDFLTEWKGTPKDKITIRHLLSMTSGLLSSKRSDLFYAFRSPDQEKYALELELEHEPGTFWTYGNPAYTLVNTILERATGMSRNDYAKKALFTPLGMNHSECTWVTLNKWFKLKHHAIKSSCRDMARFGQFILQGGKWKGKQLLSKDFIAQATKPSQDLNPAYGFLWWLNGSDHYRLPYRENDAKGMLFSGCPPDTFAALGAKDSKIYVVPSLDLVVSRLGGAATNDGSVAPSEFDAPFLKMICDAVAQKPKESPPAEEPKPQAGTTPAIADKPSSYTQELNEPLIIPVLVLKYFPVKPARLDSRSGGDDKIDINVTGDWGATLKETRAKTERQTSEVISALEEGSKYHGYKDKNAKPSLKYNIVETLEFLEPLPTFKKPGHNVPMTDYYKIISSVKMKDWVEKMGVKEVWIWGYHGGIIGLWESNMAGPYGDISNSDRDPLDLPVLKKTYTVYHYNYQRGTSEAVEDHMHQMEAVMNYVDGRDNTPPDKWDTLLFWGKFVGSDKSHKIINPGCGWSHYPPNAEKDYNWANKRYVMSDIEDWKPDGSGEKQSMNCEKWQGNSLKWFIYWMQNIPGKNNGLVYNNNPLNNWWIFIGDFDNAMKNKLKLAAEPVSAK
ncbi:MAG: serine hydrolase [Planctomycetota bacterium]